MIASLTMDADANKAYDYSKTLLPAKNMLFTCYDVDDPQFSPTGCCQGALICLAYGEPWLKVPPARYFERKYEFAQHMLKVLYKVFPECENHTEEIEVLRKYGVERTLEKGQVLDAINTLFICLSFFLFWDIFF